MKAIYPKNCVAMLLLMAFCSMKALAAVSIPTSVGQYMDWSEATLTNCNVENGGANIGSTHNGSKAEFTLANDNKMDYILTFASGANGLTAVVNWTLTDANGQEIYSEDFNISNTDSWNLTEAHTAPMGKVPAGNLTLTMSVKSTTGNYAGNFGRLAIYSYDDYYAAYPQVPSDAFFPLNEPNYSTYKGCRYEAANDNIGYITDGTSAEHLFYASQTAYYDLSMGVTRYGEGTITATVTDVATGMVECSEVFEVPNASGYAQQTLSFKDPIATKGVKKLTMTFNNGGGFILNYKNLTLAKRAPYGDQGTMYKVEYSQNLEEAGTITQTPSGKEAEAGSNVKFTAKPNFGYHFTKWTDAEGNTLSTNNPYTVAVKGDINVIGVFDKVTTYELALNVEGAYENMITIAPAPTVVGNKYLYEEGTEVTLTASENEAVSFNYWSDGSTNKTMSFIMDKNQDITATFANGDYIAAWDFHRAAGTMNSINADFFSSYENNSASLYLRDLDTNETGKRGIWERDNNQCVIWGVPVNFAYEWCVNAANYENISVKLTTWYSYNYWEKVQAQWSVDAETWNNIDDPITMTSSATVHTWTLPAAASHNEKLYFRLLPDLTSPVLNEGASDYRPIWISDVYIFGKEAKQDDGKAPQFLGSVPTDGAKGASSTGRIVLTFDEKVYATNNFRATLNGEAIKGTGAGVTYIFPYSALKYDTEYTFVLAAGSIADATGNAIDKPITLSFSTMKRTQPSPRLFDAVVAKDGSGDYTTINEALKAAPSDRTSPWLIFIKEGVYEEQVILNKPFIHLVGEGRDKVILSWYGLSGAIGDDLKAQAASKGIKYAEGGDASYQINASDFYAEGVTFENSYGYKMLNGPQALAMKAVKDRAIFNKVEMRSYQDTYFSSPLNGRQYIKDSWITGAVDFIYGQGNVYFDTDTININRPSGGWIVAPNHEAATTWGYVFQNTLITTTSVKNPEDYQVSLGRPWHNNPKTVFLHTKMEVTPVDSLWSTWGGLPAVWAVYDMSDKNGNPRNVESRHMYYNDETPAWWCKYSLTDAEAAEYTIANVLRGNDDWLPEQICEQTSSPVIANNEGVISWDNVPYAICYLILKNGKAFEFTTNSKYAAREKAKYSVKAVSEYGVLSNASNTVEVTKTATSINQQKATATGSSEAYGIGGQKASDNSRGIIIRNGQKIAVK